VVTTVTPGDRNRVNLNFNVVEGEVAKIKDIRIVGNKAYPESTLRDLFDLDTGGWMSWYTKADRYSRAKLNADLETLRSYYLSRGYLEFKVDSTQVAISPDKRDMSVTINVSEGSRFVVSAISLEGEYLGKEQEFKSLVTMRAGEAYNAEDVNRTVKAFNDYFGAFGYAFAQVEASPVIDRTNNRVAFVLRAQPSRRVYVRRINIEGNNRTRDEIVRREFRQLESAWYDSDRIRLSRDRIDRLGFFTDVGVETEPVPGTNDQVDLTVTVVEKPTGNLSVGAGYSQADKLSFIASIKQENVFGSGNYLGLDLNTSKFNRQFVLSTTDPYFTQDGISRTFDVYYKTSRPFDAQGGDYEITTPGIGIRFGVPFTENDTVFFGAGAERVKVTEGDKLPEAYRDQGGTYLPATVGWARDQRDSALVPTTGRYQRFNSEFGLGGDRRYAKLTYQFQQYLPITRQYTFAFNTEVGVGKGLGGKPFPVLRNFYGGGLGSVRGFDQGTLGPTSAVVGSTTDEKVNIGGSRNIVFNAEFIAPFPGAGNDRTLRWFAFIDAGNVYGESESVDFSQLRSSVGVGLSWISPVGPLRFALANPVRKFSGDRIQKFQFQIGTSF
jgi:outer membrane protein insertion porin family